MSIVPDVMVEIVDPSDIPVVVNVLDQTEVTVVEVYDIGLPGPEGPPGQAGGAETDSDYVLLLENALA